jgi:uncharacterized protein
VAQVGKTAPPAGPPPVPPAKKALIDQLLVATGHAKIIQNTQMAMQNQFRSDMRRQLPPQVTDALIEKAVTDFAVQAKKEDFSSAIVRTYADSYTDQELKDLTTFYQSPVGKKFVEKNPVLLSVAAQLGSMIYNRVANTAAEKHKAAIEAVLKSAAPAKK